VTKHRPTKHNPKRSSHQHPPVKPTPPDTTPDAPEKTEAVDDAAESEIERLQTELEAANGRELRCLAELENYRKRAARELEEQIRYANLELLRDVLPVIDNIERAVQAGEKKADADALLEGFKMVGQQLEDVLKCHHCNRIEALHEPFDPNFHHAILQQPSEEHPANTVLIVTQNGYQLHDRVVRPSQVIVSTTE